jgi:hypothetical protein
MCPQPAILIAQRAIARDAEEVGVGHVQLGLERLRRDSCRHPSHWLRAGPKRRNQRGSAVGKGTSFFMAAQNSWLVSPPEPLLSRICGHASASKTG